MNQIIVIGAGASGMLAAISAARAGASVTVLEGMERPGKKLLVTGNGRCNLTNLVQRTACYYGAEPSFTETVLAQFNAEDTLAFFREIGLLTTERGGYVYPLCGQAASVLEVLLLEMKRLHIKVKCSEKVTAIEKKKERFKVYTQGWCYEADKVILSAGSKAAPATGSDGSGYALAAGCGHRIISPLAALVPLKIKETWIRKLAGLRMQARVSFEEHCASGELQWTDYGISGIVVFQVSRFAVKALAEDKKAEITLDLLPQLTEEELFAHLKGIRSGKTMEEMLAGVLAKKAVPVFLAQAGLSLKADAGCAADEVLYSLVRKIKQTVLTVSGSRSFEAAQVCQGGVDCAQVDPGTMESKVLSGLYLTGELLDVDGICGGYNLQFAWASGYTAGTAAARQC